MRAAAAEFGPGRRIEPGWDWRGYIIGGFALVWVANGLSVAQPWTMLEASKRKAMARISESEKEAG